jgi:4-hydroxythreonine-4-phosphate dehydrogenase
VFHDLPLFYLIGDPGLLRGVAKKMSSPPPIKEIAEPAEAADVFDTALPILPIALAGRVKPGRPNTRHATAVMAAIEQAVSHARAGAAAAVVTNPIQKSVLHKAGFKHPGHTEYLAELCAAKRSPVMLLSCPGLKAVPVTIHLPLQEAVAALTTDLIVERALTTAAALERDFGLSPPRLAVAGLNPHAGEDGELGSAERDIILPAVRRIAAEGIDVAGPLPADSMFHAEARRAYDAAICMYHDQALIPIKTIAFEFGINVTLGLPIVRTSPDHGTALDLAGRNEADPASLISAIGYAGLIARRRRRFG